MELRELGMSWMVLMHGWEGPGAKGGGNTIGAFIGDLLGAKGLVR